MNVKTEQLPETDVAVLGLLAEKPSYGYEIEQRVESRGMRSWTHMERSSIYNSLKRLERNDLVRSEKKEVHGRLRRIYYPSEAGYKALRTQLYRYLSVPAKELTNFDLGLGNIYALSRGKAIEALTAYLAGLDEGIDFLDSGARRMRQVGVDIAAWLFERPRSELKARREWIKSFIEELKQSRFPGEKAGNQEEN